jgi:DNA-binding MarR family transcriptional regulator
MGLEEDIKQRKFKSQFQKAGINLAFTYSFMVNRNMRMMKKYGLTLPQFNILRILRGQYPKSTTVNDLIDRMLDKSSNASRIVEKLRAKKLVERKVSELDRRAVDVSITQSGLNLLTLIDKVEQEFYHKDHHVMPHHYLCNIRRMAVQLQCLQNTKT